MSSVRASYDPTRPALLASEQTIEGRVFRVDEELPWRELGISEHVLHDFWRAGLVYFTVAKPVTLDHGDGKLETIMMTPGPKVYVNPTPIAPRPAPTSKRSQRS